MAGTTAGVSDFLFKFEATWGVALLSAGFGASRVFLDGTDDCDLAGAAGSDFLFKFKLACGVFVSVGFGASRATLDGADD